MADNPESQPHELFDFSRMNLMEIILYQYVFLIM
jgi:hypothetical protein